MRFLLGVGLTRKHAASFALVLGLLSNAASAQVTKIDSPSDFVDAINLSFEQLPAQRTEIALSEEILLEGDEYASQGLTFLSPASSHPIAVSVALVWVIGPSAWDVGIKNSSDGGTSAGQAFMLRFQYPVARLGLTLGNGTAQTAVTVKAFGVTGEYLGSVSRTGALTPVTNGPAEPLPFVGLSSTVPVASVSVDYGDDPAGEEIHDLYLEYFTPRVFVTYVPQVADGVFGNASVRTILQIQNAFEASTPVKVDFVQNDKPLAIHIDGQSQTRLTVDLAGESCRQFETSGTASPAALGFARIESTLPVKAQALYQIRPGEDVPFQESGFQSTPARLLQIVPIDLDRDKGLDTAIAFVNGSDKSVAVGARLVRPDGSSPAPEPGMGDYSASRIVPPGSNLALFVSELVPYLRNLGEFKGSLVIGSGTPVAVAAVRTINGIAVSSVPAVGTER